VRILLDYRPALRRRTGVGEYVHGLASALLAELTPDDQLVLFSSSLRDRLARTVVPGASVVDARVPVRVLNYAWHRLEWPPVEMLAGPADIVHAAHPLLIPARGGVRAITLHDLDFLDHPERARAEIRRDYPELVPAHARRADLVVVNSQQTATQATDRLGVPSDRIVICRPGAPTSPRRAEPAAVGPILFLGTIEPRKNLDVLFRAYARILTSRRDVPSLVLAGPTVEQSTTILQPLNEPPLAGHVRHVGYVGEVARRKLFEEASMLVIPSLEEGFGIPALEAMAAGVPVIASRRGALPEVVGDAGTLVDALDDVAFAAAIDAVLADPARRRAHADAGVARARQFTWKESAVRVLAAYRTSLERTRAVRQPRGPSRRPAAAAPPEIEGRHVRRAQGGPDART
jgi:glycosyltransferase involved in cell wall biosynthesis